MRENRREFAIRTDGHVEEKLSMDKPVVVDVVTDTYAVAKKPWVPN